MKHAAMVQTLARKTLTRASLAGAMAMLLLGASAASAESSTVHTFAETAPVAQELQSKTTKQAVAEVIVLHGTNDGKGIDPSIGKLPQLKQPPFSAYDSYKLLERSSLALKDGPASLELPDKGTFKLELKEVQAGKAGKPRYVLQASINKAGGKKFLPAMKVNAASGDIFFIAGQKYKGGVLVLGIRVVPSK